MSKLNVDKALREINELISGEAVDAAYIKYVALVEQIESDEYTGQTGLKAEVYSSFAFFLFSVSEYDFFFTMLSKAQQYGYTSDETENFLWEAFIKPNELEFKTNYEKNLQFLLSNESLCIQQTIDFDKLPYWLLPIEVENVYYLYNKKNKRIEEKINLFDYQSIASLPTTDSFSDYLVLLNWNPSNVISCVSTINRMNKKSYIVLSDIGKFLSCFQGALLDNSILSNVLIFDQLENMNDYFMRTGAFLPRNIVNFIDSKKKDQSEEILSNIHNRRLTHQQRKGDRVLLSICIPSFNRGNRAYDNVLHLLQSQYDEEIEIILSNNGTKNETAQHYNKIKEINDARLTYFAFDENQGYALNCCKLCELAKGEFILIASDEDLVNLSLLGEVMNQLHDSKEVLSYMKTSSTNFYKLQNSYKKAGKDAMLTYMLNSLYVSGIIMNNSILKQHKGIEYVREHLNDNSVCYWYPHVFWELLLFQYGDACTNKLVLIVEGAPEEFDGEHASIDSNDTSIPYYRSIESRLEQHEDYYRIFQDLEICKSDSNLLREMYLKLCYLTFFLVNLSYETNYKTLGVDRSEFFNRAYDFCTHERFFQSELASSEVDREIAIINQIMVNQMQ
ncbi:N-glycosyltransferase [compost metagenome]